MPAIWPRFLSKEFGYLHKCDTYEDAYALVLERPVEERVQIFLEGAEEPTWVKEGGGEWIERLYDHFTTLFWRGGLPLPLTKKIASAVKPHYAVLSPYLQKDLTILIEGEEYRESSLLFAPQSPLFLDLIMKSRKEGKRMEIKGVSKRIFLQIEEYITTGKVEYLWREEPQDILSLLRRVTALGLEGMAQYSAGIYKRYLDVQNISDHLLMAQKENLEALERECCFYLGNRFSGLEVEVLEGEGFSLTIQDIEEEMLPILRLVAPKVTAIACRGGVLLHEEMIAILLTMPHLHHADFSDTNGVAASLIEGFPPVKTLYLKRCSWLDADKLFQIMSHTPSIIHLSLSGNTQIFFPGTGVIATFRQLSDFDLSHCSQIGDDEIDLLAACCPQLLSLSLEGCADITDSGVTELGKQCRELLFLDLSYCPKITNEGILSLASASSHIETLRLSGCRGISEEGVRQLLHLLFRLRELNIEGVSVPRGVVEELKDTYQTVTINS